MDICQYTQIATLILWVAPRKIVIFVILYNYIPDFLYKNMSNISCPYYYWTTNYQFIQNDDNKSNVTKIAIGYVIWL